MSFVVSHVYRAYVDTYVASIDGVVAAENGTGFGAKWQSIQVTF